MPSPEQKAGIQERCSITAAYIINAVMMVDHWEDSDYWIYYVNQEAHWPNGESISDEDYQNVASTSVLRQIADSFNDMDVLLLKPELPKALPIYLTAQNVLDEIGFRALKQNLDKDILMKVTKRFTGQDVPSSVYIEMAVRLWEQRGMVNLEMIDIEDLAKATEAQAYSGITPNIYEERGSQLSGHTLPEVHSYTHQMPYYLSFHDIKHSRVWLDSLLEDIIQLNRMLQ